MSNRPRIVCFGEALWDSTTKGLFLGGAPANVAFHLHQIGLCSLPATAVGNDFLGEEILRRIGAWGIETKLITTVQDRRTGVVQVYLASPDNPSYVIADDVAWDCIPESSMLIQEVKAASALVFGSLALRHAANRRLIELLLTTAPGVKIFDVNLREPYFDLNLVRHLASRADLVKVNLAELEVLHPVAVGNIEMMAAAFSLTTLGAQVVVTCGSSGAGWWRDGSWYWCDAKPVALNGDAVGAGDAFLAGLIKGILERTPPERALSFACRLAELVAASDGAQPIYDISVLAPS